MNVCQRIKATESLVAPNLIPTVLLEIIKSIMTVQLVILNVSKVRIASVQVPILLVRVTAMSTDFKISTNARVTVLIVRDTHEGS
jgi:hypothetical protein